MGGTIRPIVGDSANRPKKIPKIQLPNGLLCENYEFLICIATVTTDVETQNTNTQSTLNIQFYISVYLSRSSLLTIVSNFLPFSS